MNFSRRTFILSTTALAVPMPAFSSSPVPELNLSSSGLAIRGVDPVSYRTEGGPKKGSRKFRVSHAGGTYYFESEANKELFESDPEKYLPAYGGYCSYGTAVNTKVDGDPYIWHIVGDQLYLNITRSVDRVWRRDIPGYIKKANENWLRLEHRPA